uniref:Uncharacterized protein n=1 Tax=Chromera velia CCMP2878 TaxID=1169474 RepID=A0A0G4HGH5_9ALVE|eukprot:Cvel_1034.t1-p1 / transcript=Cvel_1034.t1 / gene=Cvel_1034 / organism=Chromera_velia_CCMP2878 / gene_product=Zinc finger protein 283, putative / transcript_product=Zinc finger protein 283, putative / location=Cvel_scaffold33:153809-155407(+) / protein_length=533 / sequence_SO=supercontig / SO=protein_coding / is_pseudo=false
MNLSECPLGVSEELEHRVETDGNVKAVRVSELNFRLVAIPNDGDIDQMPDLHNLVRLEPLKGGDFRVVRLVGAPPFPDYSSVGERGDNTIRVGVEAAGEQQRREVVGISVEWGVPESVQLALLPRPSNSQTEHSQRESFNDCSVLSGHRSAAGCPTSSEGGGQGESGRLNSMDGQGGKLGVSVCHSQTADAVRGSDGQRGGVEGENRVRESGRQERSVKEDFPRSELPNAVRDSHCPSDAKIDSRSLSYPPPSPTCLSSYDLVASHTQAEERGRTQAAPLKRRLSESALTQIENDDCKELLGSSDGVGREGKQRRLTVTLSPSGAALLSSDSFREREDPIVEGRVVSGNDFRGRKQEEVKRDRHRNILCPHGRIRRVCKECGGKGICEHGRQRSNCRDCGGKSICEHGRIRCRCKDCGGKSICEHSRERNKCKDCGGKSICEHGRERNKCKDCGGKGICEHGCVRSKCRECGGKSICEHGRQRTKCKECGGKSVCVHGRQRYYCKDCGGNGICIHRKDRRYCLDCKLVSSLPS